DVTKLNALAKAYGQFDFERGWFDLVIELDARGGHVDGYVKPLFRQLRVFSLKHDVAEKDPIHAFWEALLGVVTGVLRNQPRDQFGTVIPLSGDADRPGTDLFDTVINILR